MHPKPRIDDLDRCSETRRVSTFISFQLSPTRHYHLTSIVTIDRHILLQECRTSDTSRGYYNLGVLT